MENNILKQAENCVNVASLKQAVEQLKDYVPSIVDINKAVYDEMLKQGFDRQQAFKFSCQYTIASVFQKGN